MTMAIPLHELLKLQYPDLAGEIGNNIQIGDRGDGPEITLWDVDGVEQPSTADLQAYNSNVNNQQKYQFYLNEIHNRDILQQLLENDLKSIRAIRANDTVYIQKYEEEAQRLRSLLLPTQ